MHLALPCTLCVYSHSIDHVTQVQQPQKRRSAKIGGGVERLLDGKGEVGWDWMEGTLDAGEWSCSLLALALQTDITAGRDK